MANILLLDDSLELLDMFHAIFTMRGFKINAVPSMNLFLQELQENRPDLILLDILLREADGRDICRDLKLNIDTQPIPIILMSANPEKLKYYKEYYADEFLEKPFDMDTLMNKVNYLLK